MLVAFRVYHQIMIGKPLFEAVCDGDLDEVKRLVSLGANLNARDSSKSWSLIHYVIAKGHTSIVKLMIESNVDLEVKTWIGRTPLHKAAQGGHVAIAELLLDAHVDIQAVDVAGWSALHVASYYGCGDVVRLLLMREIDTSLISKKGLTAKDIARKEGYTDIVQMIEDHENAFFDMKEPDNLS